MRASRQAAMGRRAIQKAADAEGQGGTRGEARTPMGAPAVAVRG
jgi:hypothetical protein